MIYPLCFLLILVGLYGVVANRNTVKIVISLLIMQHGVHLLLILIGYRTKDTNVPERVLPSTLANQPPPLLRVAVMVKSSVHCPINSNRFALTSMCCRNAARSGDDAGETVAAGASSP